MCIAGSTCQAAVRNHIQSVIYTGHASALLCRNAIVAKEDRDFVGLADFIGISWKGAPPFPLRSIVRTGRYCD